MQFTSLRRAAALVALAALAACAGNGAVPQQPLNSGALPAPQADLSAAPLDGTTAAIQGDVVSNAGSPCDIKGIWYFRGACTVQNMKRGGMAIALSEYKGLSVTIGFPKNDAPANTPFLIGDGTGSTDITGTFQNKKFPVYGKVPCYTTSGKQTKCPGKGFLYVEVINASKNSVKFSAVPSVQITDTKSFPGTHKCQLDLLNFSPQGWLLLPIYGTPNKGKVTFPSLHATLTFPGDSLAVFGMTCQ